MSNNTPRLVPCVSCMSRGMSNNTPRLVPCVSCMSRGMSNHDRCQQQGRPVYYLFFLPFICLGVDAGFEGSYKAWPVSVCRIDERDAK